MEGRAGRRTARLSAAAGIFLDLPVNGLAGVSGFCLQNPEFNAFGPPASLIRSGDEAIWINHVLNGSWAKGRSV